MTDLSEAVVAIGDYAVGGAAERKNRDRFAMTPRLAAKAQRVRVDGSAAIDFAWLASGRVDAIAMLANWHPMDCGPAHRRIPVWLARRLAG